MKIGFNIKIKTTTMNVSVFTEENKNIMLQQSVMLIWL